MSFGRLLSDVRLALRSLLATPAFSGFVVCVLSLGLGASVAIFSVVDATALRPLPFDRSNRLVAIGQLNSGAFDAGWQTPQDFLDWRDRQDVFTDIAASGFAAVSLKPVGGAPPESLVAAVVTARFFEVLGVSPILGRTFTRANETDSGGRFAIISYDLWQRRYLGRPDAIGAILPGQRGDFQIIGVMPPSFAYPPGAFDPADVWLPRVFAPTDQRRGSSFDKTLRVIGRLKDGVSLSTARARMQLIQANLAAAYPRFDGRSIDVESLHATLVGSVRAWMELLLAAVVSLLLIACVNVANLLLARAIAREHELRIRSALGGSTWDVVSLLLTESLVLSLFGAALGVLAASGGVQILRSALPPTTPGIADIAVNTRVLFAAVLAAVATGLGCGLAPALQVARSARGGQLLADAGRTQTASLGRVRLRAALVMTEVALATMLVVAAGLFLTSFARVTSVDLGFDYRGVQALLVRPIDYNLSDDPDRVSTAHRAAFSEILDRARALPGVDSVALISGGLPLRGDLITEDVTVPGQHVPAGEEVEVNSVSPEYFHVLRIPLLEGRDFTAADRVGSPAVLILNASAARSYFPGQDPLGRVIEFGGKPRTVIGVVGDIRRDGPESPPRRQSFSPLAQSHFVGGATVLVRSTIGTSALGSALEQVVWSAFPAVPLDGVTPMEFYLRTMLAPRRLNMLLIGLFGLVGLAIAAAGIYAVTAFLVAQRTREIGIRLALGAAPSRVSWAVVLGSSRAIGVGLAIGLAGTWFLATAVERFLFAVSGHTVAIYVVAGAALLVAGLLAAAIPARRASRLDPVRALRV